MIIAGNWKMNLNRQAAVSLAQTLDAWCAGNQGKAGQKEMIIFPPAIHINAVHDALSQETAVILGGQDCHPDDAGAHTGDISASMLVDAGCRWVLVGHSERRQNHGESSSLIAAKVSQALKNSLSPMVCVGENLTEREEGHAFDVIEKQLQESLPLKDMGDGKFAGAIAYEPVWAIGTGRVASPEDINDMHVHIRAVLSAMFAGGADTPILYGGSVKPDNAAAILDGKDVGGVLVGGASLSAKDFLAIAES